MKSEKVAQEIGKIFEREGFTTKETVEFIATYACCLVNQFEPKYADVFFNKLKEISEIRDMLKKS